MRLLVERIFMHIESPKIELYTSQIFTLHRFLIFFITLQIKNASFIMIKIG